MSIVLPSGELVYNFSFVELHDTIMINHIVDAKLLIKLVKHMLKILY